MTNKYIYFLIVVLAYPQLTKMYFLNDDLGTNLPDRYGNNCEDKRSPASDSSSYSKEFDNIFTNDKESPDLDYKNGNADIEDEEIGQKEHLEKRESKIKRNFNKV